MPKRAWVRHPSGPLRPSTLGEHVRLRDAHLVEDDLPGDARAQAHLAVHGRRLEALHAALDDEAADGGGVAVVDLGPHHGEVGDGGRW
jgi:hypothetical protein